MDLLEQLETVFNSIQIRTHWKIFFLETPSYDLTEYEEKYMRILIERITVYDDHLKVNFKSSISVDIKE